MSAAWAMLLRKAGALCSGEFNGICMRIIYINFDIVYLHIVISFQFLFYLITLLCTSLFVNASLFYISVHYMR